MLIIRHYFNWSLRATEQFVKDSFSSRQVARVYFDKVPHYSTLSRHENSIPAATPKQIDHHIVQIAQNRQITKGRQLRVDSTVVKTNIHYATDSSLFVAGVRLLARLMQRVKRAGMATGELVRGFRRSAKR